MKNRLIIIMILILSVNYNSIAQDSIKQPEKGDSSMKDLYAKIETVDEDGKTIMLADLKTKIKRRSLGSAAANISVSNKGEIYITTPMTDDCIIKLDKSGNILNERDGWIKKYWDSKKERPVFLDYSYKDTLEGNGLSIKGIDVGIDGNLYIVERNTKHVYILNDKGEVLRVFQWDKYYGAYSPGGILTSTGYCFKNKNNLWCYVSDNNMIRVYDCYGFGYADSYIQDLKDTELNSFGLLNGSLFLTFIGDNSLYESNDCRLREWQKNDLLDKNGKIIKSPVIVGIKSNYEIVVASEYTFEPSSKKVYVFGSRLELLREINLDYFFSVKEYFPRGFCRVGTCVGKDDKIYRIDLHF